MEKLGRSILVALFGASLCVTISASAKTIVIQSSGPSASRYPSGRLLQEPLSIDLRKGDILKILDAAGTRVLTGPTKIRDAAPRKIDSEKQLALKNLMFSKNQRRSRTGAVRDVGSDATANGAIETPADSNASTLNDLWVVDPLTAGDWCVQNLDEVELWRADAENSANLTVVRTTGAREDARWPKGGSVTYWPANIPTNNGERYFVQVDNEEGNFITLHQVEKTDDIVELATALEARQCDVQFDILLADIR
jgi:hypothetical protein